MFTIPLQVLLDLFDPKGNTEPIPKPLPNQKDPTGPGGE